MASKVKQSVADKTVALLGTRANLAEVHRGNLIKALGDHLSVIAQAHKKREKIPMEQFQMLVSFATQLMASSAMFDLSRSILEEGAK